MPYPLKSSYRLLLAASLSLYSTLPNLVHASTADCTEQLVQNTHSEDFPAIISLANRVPDAFRLNVLSLILSDGSIQPARSWTATDPEWQSAAAIVNLEWQATEQDLGPIFRLDLKIAAQLICSHLSSQEQIETAIFFTRPRFHKARNFVDAIGELALSELILKQVPNDATLLSLRRDAHEKIAKMSDKAFQDALEAEMKSIPAFYNLVLGSRIKSMGPEIGQTLIDSAMTRIKTFGISMSAHKSEIDDLYAKYQARVGATPPANKEQQVSPHE